MGWSEREVRCKNHPDHNQSQGVCASCLREKLTDLYVPSQNYKRPPSRSSSPSSLDHQHHHHKRFGSEIMGSMPYIVSVGSGLKKSKSHTTVPRNKAAVVGEGNKKKGFWSKLLLQSKGNKKEVLMHSRTASARFY